MVSFSFFENIHKMIAYSYLARRDNVYIERGYVRITYSKEQRAENMKTCKTDDIRLQEFKHSIFYASLDSFQLPSNSRMPL
jgi:hypothetical protein